MSNTFGLHTFAIAPVWDLARIEPQIEKLKEYGIGLMEIPLLRPSEIDTKAARAFAGRHGVELVPSLGLPGTIDVVDQPQDGLDFLEPAFRVCAEIGGFGLAGVTYGTIGKTTGRAPTQREIDGVCRFLERAAKGARAHGIRLGIEPCNRYETHLINTGKDAARIVDASAPTTSSSISTPTTCISRRRASPPASRRRRLSSAISTCRRPIAACRGAAC